MLGLSDNGIRRMKFIKLLGITLTSFIMAACQSNGIKKWDNATFSYPSVHVGSNTADVINISYEISVANQNELTQDSLTRLQKARDWINQINAESISIEQLAPIALNNIDTVNPNAYLYIDEYNVRLGKVRIGLGRYSNLRLASLGLSDKSNIYSNLNIYNCQDRTSVTAIVYTYATGTGEAHAFAPDPQWREPVRGSAQRWLMNAVCSATLVKGEDGSLAIGYSVLLNQLG